MRITWKEKPTDPVHPIMAGKTPIAKEFNKRQAELWSKGAFTTYDYEQVTTVLLEIFADEYNKIHKPEKKVKKELTNQQL